MEKKRKGMEALAAASGIPLATTAGAKPPLGGNKHYVEHTIVQSASTLVRLIKNLTSLVKLDVGTPAELLANKRRLHELLQQQQRELERDLVPTNNAFLTPVQGNVANDDNYAV